MRIEFLWCGKTEGTSMTTWLIGGSASSSWRLLGVACLGLCPTLVACNGNVGGHGNGNGTVNVNGSGNGSGAAANGTGGGSATANGGTSSGAASGAGSDPTLNPTGTPITPFASISTAAAVRKVKNLLVGMPPTDAEVQSVTAATDKAAAFRDLINTWTGFGQTTLAPQFHDKMVGFFRNSFQQTGFTPTQDFKPQLLENGGFDLGPLGVYADDAFTRLIQNLQDSFALTAWDMVQGGKPFTSVLTTNTFEMTTALKSLYLQIEMPNDEPYAFGAKNKLAWSVNMDGTAIPLTDTLNPSSPNYMIFDDQVPATKIGFQLTPTCQGTAVVNAFTGYAQLFQRLFGFTPRFPFAAQPQCWEHASLPYFTTSDLTDWTSVTVSPKASSDAYVQPYDLPTLRTAKSLALAMPRVGFFSTPAYLALWNTNDSNQHRVTANQTLLVAWGTSFTSANAVTPTSETGLDATHAVNGTECYGCHKSLDPLRQFWANQFDFNDRNDFPAANGFGAGKRPTTTGGTLAFGSVNATGTSLADLGNLLASGVDSSSDPAVSQFAISFAQKLCYFADSAACSQDDPEFRRVAKAFQDANFDFMTLIREMFSSPLVTDLASTKTFTDRNIDVSILRRDQLCASLSNRMGIPDLCALHVAFPFSSGFGADQNTTVAAQRAAFQIAGSLPADGFSRGSEIPVTPATPTLFFRAASEMLCENVAAVVVDTTGSRYSSTALDTAIPDMVVTIMGYPPSDSHYASALQILQAHYAEALPGNTATNALRSTFSLACQSPTSLAFGI
jgi:hypothetical protein